ncbi:kinase-like domain-containing protein [Leptodontidium sp. 2 PMI_412]|nr:kinase-like domain-containing protein [Leptodontidium sp. 2 PMI_412]
MPTEVGTEIFPLEGRDLKSITRDEIIASIPLAPKLRSAPGTWPVHRITSSIILKCGREAEARTMRYISSHTSIPVPAVIDAWEVENARYEDEPNTCYILMDYVQGQVLEDVWGELSSKAQVHIQTQIYEYMCQLRNLHFEIPGPIGGGVCQGFLFTACNAGPFKSANELEAWYNGRLAVCHMFRRATHIPPGAFSGTFKELVVYHLDVNPRNIILGDGGKVWLIDWGLAGAYPPWFEKGMISWASAVKWKLGLLELFGKETWKEEVDLLLSVGFALTTGGYCQPQARPLEDTTVPTGQHQ